MTLLEVNDRGQGHIITNMTFVDLNKTVGGIILLILGQK